MAQQGGSSPVPIMGEPKSELMDTFMSDIPADTTSSPAHPTTTQTPVRHSTPGATPHRQTNGDSRSASLHPETAPQAVSIPSEAPIHGAPVRQYLNSKVTESLLAGMKLLARDQPKEPLKVLGEFLLQRSKELEGTQ